MDLNKGLSFKEPHRIPLWDATGVFSPEQLAERFLAAADVASGREHKISLFLLLVRDGFEESDTHDQRLTRVAETLKGALGDGPTFCGYFGSNEFVIFSIDPEADQVPARIMAALEQAGIKSASSETGLVQGNLGGIATQATADFSLADLAECLGHAGSVLETARASGPNQWAFEDASNPHPVDSSASP